MVVVVVGGGWWVVGGEVLVVGCLVGSEGRRDDLQNRRDAENFGMMGGKKRRGKAGKAKGRRVYID